MAPLARSVIGLMKEGCPHNLFTYLVVLCCEKLASIEFESFYTLNSVLKAVHLFQFVQGIYKVKTNR